MHDKGPIKIALDFLASQNFSCPRARFNRFLAEFHKVEDNMPGLLLLGIIAHPATTGIFVRIEVVGSGWRRTAQS